MAKNYKEDGVNIDAGDAFSRFCNKINQSTYGNSPYVEILDFSQGNFRGPKGFLFKNLPEGCIETGAVDGIGTKVAVIVASGRVRSSASNVIAMTAMDITRWGGLPLLFMNILDVHSLGEFESGLYRSYEDIMVGLRRICDVHKFVSFTGETAEIGLCVGSEISDSDIKFNWGGVMMGVYHPDKMILGSTLAPGQIIMALQDLFRSNGFSSVRRAFFMKYGPQWWLNPDAMEDIIDAAEGSAQYDRFFNTLHGWFNAPSFKPLVQMHLIVHLSGGAFKSKLAEDILQKSGLSAEITDLFSPLPIMKKCAEWRRMSHEECYETWNGGQGVIAVIDPQDEEFFIGMAEKFGINAKRAGKITKKKKYNVRIRSMFDDNKKKFIEY